MITEKLMDFFTLLVNGFAALLDFPDPPAAVTAIPGYVADVGAYLSGLNPWVPLDLTALLLGAWAVSLVAAFAIKITRIVASFATAGGGSAG